ncbi:MAG: CPBP family intramembrane glutamic endopeptidase [Candidatus Thorarchaeota archaeon]
MKPLDYKSQPHEVRIAAVSVIVLIVLIPFDLSRAGDWFFGSVLLFFFWATIGFPPTVTRTTESSIEAKDTCIYIGFRYKIKELKEDLTKVKLEILGLVFLLRPLLIMVDEFFRLSEPSASNPMLLLVVGPLLEEFYYRGILQERLSWFISQKYAIVLSSVIFSYSHIIPGLPLDMALVTRFIISLVFAGIYAKTRNILTSFVAHFGVNLWCLLPI